VFLAAWSCSSYITGEVLPIIGGYYDSELLGGDPSLTVIRPKDTKETETTRYQTKHCLVGRAGHLNDDPTKSLLHLDLKIGNLGYASHFNTGRGPKLQTFRLAQG
jgi:hypothetical protein